MKFIQDISNFIFLKDEPQQVDIIFVPGGGFPQPSELAAELYKQGFTKLILPSGRHSILAGEFRGVSEKSNIYNKPYHDEWEFMTDVLTQNGVPFDVVLKENRAENTYQNAMFSKQTTDAQGLEIKKAIICCKAQHSRRCQMYYQLSFPTTEFFICPVVVEGIDKSNWHTTEAGVNSVMGEILRIGQQFGSLI